MPRAHGTGVARARGAQKPRGGQQKKNASKPSSSSLESGSQSLPRRPSPALAHPPLISNPTIEDAPQDDPEAPPEGDRGSSNNNNNNHGDDDREEDDAESVSESESEPKSESGEPSSADRGAGPATRLQSDAAQAASAPAAPPVHGDAAVAPSTGGDPQGHETDIERALRAELAAVVKASRDTEVRLLATLESIANGTGRLVPASITTAAAAHEAAILTETQGEYRVRLGAGVARDEGGGGGGARLVEVDPWGAAAQAGLRVGDVIESVGGVPVATPSHLRAELDRERMAAKVPVRVRHADGSFSVLSLPAFNSAAVNEAGASLAILAKHGVFFVGDETVQKMADRARARQPRPPAGPAPPAGDQHGQPRLGVEVVPFSRIGGGGGVRIVAVFPGELADRAGLCVDDVVETLDGQPVRDGPELRSAMASSVTSALPTISLAVTRRTGQRETVLVHKSAPAAAGSSHPESAPAPAPASAHPAVQQQGQQQGRAPVRLGIQLVQHSLRGGAGAVTDSLRIVKVLGGEPADLAGLHVDDVLEAVDGRPVRSGDEFRSALDRAATSASPTLSLTITRRTGARETVSVSKFVHGAGVSHLAAQARQPAATAPPEEDVRGPPPASAPPKPAGGTKGSVQSRTERLRAIGCGWFAVLVSAVGMAIAAIIIAVSFLVRESDQTATEANNARTVATASGLSGLCLMLLLEFLVRRRRGQGRIQDVLLALAAVLFYVMVAMLAVLQYATDSRSSVVANGTLIILFGTPAVAGLVLAYLGWRVRPMIPVSGGGPAGGAAPNAPGVGGGAPSPPRAATDREVRPARFDEYGGLTWTAVLFGGYGCSFALAYVDYSQVEALSFLRVLLMVLSAYSNRGLLVLVASALTRLSPLVWALVADSNNVRNASLTYFVVQEVVSALLLCRVRSGVRPLWVRMAFVVGAISSVVYAFVTALYPSWDFSLRHDHVDTATGDSSASLLPLMVWLSALAYLVALFLRRSEVAVPLIVGTAFVAGTLRSLGQGVAVWIAALVISGFATMWLLSRSRADAEALVAQVESARTVAPLPASGGGDGGEDAAAAAAGVGASARAPAPAGPGSLGANAKAVSKAAEAAEDAVRGLIDRHWRVVAAVSFAVAVAPVSAAVLSRLPNRTETDDRVLDVLSVGLSAPWAYGMILALSRFRAAEASQLARLAARAGLNPAYLAESASVVTVAVGRWVGRFWAVAVQVALLIGPTLYSSDSPGPAVAACCLSAVAMAVQALLPATARADERGAGRDDEQDDTDNSHPSDGDKAVRGFCADVTFDSVLGVAAGSACLLVPLLVFDVSGPWSAAAVGLYFTLHGASSVWAGARAAPRDRARHVRQLDVALFASMVVLLIVTATSGRRWARSHAGDGRATYAAVCLAIGVILLVPVLALSILTRRRDRALRPNGDQAVRSAPGGAEDGEAARKRITAARAATLSFLFLAFVALPLRADVVRGPQDLVGLLVSVVSFLVVGLLAWQSHQRHAVGHPPAGFGAEAGQSPHGDVELAHSVSRPAAGPGISLPGAQSQPSWTSSVRDHRWLLVAASLVALDTYYLVTTYVASLLLMCVLVAESRVFSPEATGLARALLMAPTFVVPLRAVIEMVAVHRFRVYGDVFAAYLALATLILHLPRTERLLGLRAAHKAPGRLAAAAHAERAAGDGQPPEMGHSASDPHYTPAPAASPSGEVLIPSGAAPPRQAGDDMNFAESGLLGPNGSDPGSRSEIYSWLVLRVLVTAGSLGLRAAASIRYDDDGGWIVFAAVLAYYLWFTFVIRSDFLYAIALPGFVTAAWVVVERTDGDPDTVFTSHTSAGPMIGMGVAVLQILGAVAHRPAGLGFRRLPERAFASAMAGGVWVLGLAAYYALPVLVSWAAALPAGAFAGILVGILALQLSGRPAASRNAAVGAVLYCVLTQLVLCAWVSTWPVAGGAVCESFFRTRATGAGIGLLLVVATNRARLLLAFGRTQADAHYAEDFAEYVTLSFGAWLVLIQTDSIATVAILGAWPLASVLLWDGHALQLVLQPVQVFLAAYFVIERRHTMGRADSFSLACVAAALHSTAVGLLVLLSRVAHARHLRLFVPPPVRSSPSVLGPLYFLWAVVFGLAGTRWSSGWSTLVVMLVLAFVSAAVSLAESRFLKSGDPTGQQVAGARASVDALHVLVSPHGIASHDHDERHDRDHDHDQEHGHVHSDGNGSVGSLPGHAGPSDDFVVWLRELPFPWLLAGEVLAWAATAVALLAAGPSPTHEGAWGSYATLRAVLLGLIMGVAVLPWATLRRAATLLSTGLVFVCAEQLACTGFYTHKCAWTYRAHATPLGVGLLGWSAVAGMWLWLRPRAPRDRGSVEADWVHALQMLAWASGSFCVAFVGDGALTVAAVAVGWAHSVVARQPGPAVYVWPLLQFAAVMVHVRERGGSTTAAGWTSAASALAFVMLVAVTFVRPVADLLSSAPTAVFSAAREVPKSANELLAMVNQMRWLVRPVESEADRARQLMQQRLWLSVAALGCAFGAWAATPWIPVSLVMLAAFFASLLWFPLADDGAEFRSPEAAAAALRGAAKKDDEIDIGSGWVSVLAHAAVVAILAPSGVVRNKPGWIAGIPAILVLVELLVSFIYHAFREDWPGFLRGFPSVKYVPRLATLQRLLLSLIVLGPWAIGVQFGTVGALWALVAVLLVSVGASAARKPFRPAQFWLGIVAMVIAAVWLLVASISQARGDGSTTVAVLALSLGGGWSSIFVSLLRPPKFVQPRVLLTAGVFAVGLGGILPSLISPEVAAVWAMVAELIVLGIVLLFLARRRPDGRAHMAAAMLLTTAGLAMLAFARRGSESSAAQSGVLVVCGVLELVLALWLMRELRVCEAMCGDSSPSDDPVSPAVQAPVSQPGDRDDRPPAALYHPPSYNY